MHKKGFTLVEVVLFLALSGALVLIVIGGTSRSIAEKRFEDTTNNFVSYLEDLYSSVDYTRGTSIGGNSDRAVYGKLIEMVTAGKKTTFTSYTVIASADTKNVNNPDALQAILALEPSSPYPTIVDTSGVVISSEEYKPSWGGWITAQENPGDLLPQILILILRHPKTGMKFTYVTYHPTGTPTTDPSFDLKTAIGSDPLSLNFKPIEVNFCIDSEDREATGNSERRLVKIRAGAKNASGVELIGNGEKEGFCS